MPDTRLGEIKAIQKRIVANLEAGEDVSSLSRQLAQVRAEIAAGAEVEELQKIADARQALKSKAEAIVKKAQAQGDAIDTFLKARDKFLAQLKPLLEPMRELAQLTSPSWEDHPGECYVYPNAGPFQADVVGIPREILPTDFACPTLEMTEPGERSLGKMKQAAAYFDYCLSILVSHRKGAMTAYPRPTDASLLLDKDEPETFEIELTCRVCSHEKAEAINKALQDGRPLRELETEYNVSRSTLSRHKNRCLNLGAIRIAE